MQCRFAVNFWALNTKKLTNIQLVIILILNIMPKCDTHLLDMRPENATKFRDFNGPDWTQGFRQSPKEQEHEQEQECSPDYITITNIYNQKVAAAGDDQLAEPALPFLFQSGMF